MGLVLPPCIIIRYDFGSQRHLSRHPTLAKRHVILHFPPLQDVVRSSLTSKVFKPVLDLILSLLGQPSLTYPIEVFRRPKVLDCH